MCWIQDETYLYCWNDVFIGTIPWKPAHNLRCVSAYQVSNNLCRILVCEKLKKCYLLEVHKIPYDFE